MLTRDTLNHGLCQVNADTEILIDSVDGMQVIIPYSDSWKKIIVQTSGGLDSALLLFLVSKSLVARKSRTEILPLSLEVPTKAKNLSSARSVINKVRELTNNPHLLPGLEIHIPLDQSENPLKNAFFNRTIVDLMTKEDIAFDFNGNTKNPPEEARRVFRDDEFRQITRDNRTTVYNGPRSASPLALVNKKGVVNLYLQAGILSELAPLTLSCDINISEATERKLNIPCQECWWCRERNWGFQSNGVKDGQPATYPSLSF